MSSNPTDAASLASAAERALEENQLPQAEKLAQEALALDPASTAARVVLGFVAAQTGRPDLAIESLKRATAQDPSLWGPRTALAVLLRMMRRTTEAIDVWNEALLLRPNEADSWYELGICYFESGRTVDAGAMFNQSIMLDEGQARFHIGLGMALEKLTLPRAAAKSFVEAAKLNHQDPFAASKVQQLAPIARTPGADPAPKGNATTAQGHFWLARLQYEARDPAEAELSYRSSLELDPEAPEVLANYGLMLQQTGRFEEGEECLAAAIRLQPTWASLYSMLVSGRKLTAKDQAFLEQMEAALNQIDAPQDRIKLLGALGKAYGDLGQYSESLRLFDEAHGLSEGLLQADGKAFDQQAYRALVDRILVEFSPENLEMWRKQGLPSDQAICIIGMIRSGTTLTEQILSSHSQIGAAGELFYWYERVGEYRARHLGTADIPVPQWGSGYLDLLTDLVPDSPRVTDKQPENYWSAPLIQACLRGTKFVHCRRHPVDTCISIYTTHNVNGPSWTHSRENIMFVYREYLRMMERWREVLPPDCLLEIDYEANVADREAVSRQMTAFLNLEWEPSMLHHEAHQGAITTPSLWQARQPIYNSSVERWRRYEGSLGVFESLLK